MSDNYVVVLKILGFFAILTVFGLWKGCEDISYMVSSESTTAQVKKFAKITGRRNRDSSMKHVLYKFIDKDGQECTGYDKVDIEWQTPSDKQIEIAYVPGKLRIDGHNTVSRLEEKSSYGGILIFLLGIGGFCTTVGLSYKTLKDS
ncbi:MAG: hypothetical protein NE330_08400 [Lentisphaeraceae bacterium]|nr:hypothetical protein [Lentisphaeraceae bacterium]